MLVDGMQRDPNLNFHIAGKSTLVKKKPTKICHQFFKEHRKKDILISCHF